MLPMPLQPDVIQIEITVNAGKSHATKVIEFNREQWDRMSRVHRDEEVSNTVLGMIDYDWKEVGR